MNGVWEGIIESIPQEERDEVWGNILTLAREVTEFNHSALGILKTIRNDYSELTYDIEGLTTKLAKPENLQLVKDVIEKLD